IPPIPPPPPGGPGGILDLPAAITSSILNNIEAAAVADFIICSLTTRGSNTSCLYMSVTFVFLTSTPVHLAPLFCLARNSAIVSIGSIPAFSARASGIESSASANFWTASCALPSRLLDHPLNSLAMYASVEPPPATTSGFSRTSFVTIKASCIDLSASSTTLCEPPTNRNISASEEDVESPSINGDECQ